MFCACPLRFCVLRVRCSRHVAELITQRKREKEKGILFFFYPPCLCVISSCEYEIG